MGSSSEVNEDRIKYNFQFEDHFDRIPSNKPLIEIYARILGGMLSSTYAKSY